MTVAFFLVVWVSSISIVLSYNCTHFEEKVKFVNEYSSSKFPKSQVNFYFDQPKISCRFFNGENSSNGENSYTYTFANNISLSVDGGLIGNLQLFHQKSSWKSINVFVKSLNSEIFSLNEITKELDYNFIIDIRNETLRSDIHILESNQFNKIKFKALLDIINENELIINASCFFCESGKSKIITVYNSSETKELPEPETLFPDFTKNFHGRSLSVMGGRGIPILNRFFKNPATCIVHAKSGFQTYLINSIAHKLNFHLNVSEPLPFGNKNSTSGMFNGMIGKVQLGEIDIGFGAATTLDRHEVVHFLRANTIQHINFVVGLAKEKTKWQAIFRSFSPESWIALFITLFGILLPTAIFCIKINIKDLKAKDALGEGIGFILRPILEQPLSNKVLKDPRISIIALIICWLFSAIVIGTAYKSILMSNMVTPLTEEVPDTYEDLAQAKDYKIYVHYVGGALSRLFGESKNPDYLEISRRTILESDISKCIQNVLKEKAACLSYRDNIEGETNRNFTDIHGNPLVHKGSGRAFSLPISVLLPKTSLYKESMEQVVQQQIDMGITDNYVKQELNIALEQGKKWAKVRPDPFGIFGTIKDQNGPASLSISHFISNFVLLGMGIFLACFVLIVEICTSKLKFQEKKKKGKAIREFIFIR